MVGRTSLQFPARPDEGQPVGCTSQLPTMGEHVVTARSLPEATP